MKNFRVQIRAYGYYADFDLKSEDTSEAFENALVDKLGKNDIKWEKDGFIDSSKTWITYEEVIDANARERLIQEKERSRTSMGGTAA
jgi:uncharacterized protein (DUF2344 family)